MTVATELNTVKDLIISVMKEVPETRNNDTLLYVECCKALGATTLDDAKALDLSIVSVHKIRQKIQNKEKMFMPDPNVKELRKARAYQIREYMKIS